jgi:hypothetical protein
MIQLEQLQPNAAVRGIVPDAIVVVVSVQWFGSQALELTYNWSFANRQVRPNRATT